MKTMILFASKAGASRACAELLATRIANCSVCDLSKQAPDIDDVDTVIIGSGVRMGRVYKTVRSFVDKNLDKLLSKRTAIYFCNGEPDTFEKAVEKNIPVQLISNSLCVKSFGGKMPFTSSKTNDWILMDNVNALIEMVEQEEVR